MEDKKIRTAVIGAGKMGSIHARVYDQLPQSELLAIVDIKPKKAQRLAERYGCLAFTKCEDTLSKVDPAKSSWIKGTGESLVETFNGVDAVTIATPTVTHLQLAKIFIKNRVAVLVEKPLAVSVREGRKMVSLARKRNSVVAVGHSERCNPVVQAVKRLNIEPLFIEADRVSPYTFRSTDVGVVLDVMIHDIDIILSLAGSKIKKIDAVGANVIDEAEDICNARIIFENGCIANITASRLALNTVRKVRVFSRQAYLSLDYLKKDGIIIKANPNVNVLKWIKEQKSANNFDLMTVNWPDLLHIEHLVIDDKEPVRLQQEAFLRSVVDQEAAPEVSAEEGLAALKCAGKILASVKKRKWDVASESEDEGLHLAKREQNRKPENRQDT
jgi:predicted dehydrogenase